MNISRRYNNGKVKFDIQFLITSDDMDANATEAGEAYNKRPKDYLRTQRAKEYINSVLRKMNVGRKCPTYTIDNLVYTIQGGTPKLQGTWMHRKIFKDYVRWLDSDLAVWCDDLFEELLKWKASCEAENLSPQLDTRIQSLNHIASMEQIKRNKPNANSFDYAARCDSLNVAASGQRSKYWRLLAQDLGLPKKYWRNAQPFFRSHPDYWKFACAVSLGHKMFINLSSNRTLSLQEEKEIYEIVKESTGLFQRMINIGMFHFAEKPMQNQLGSTNIRQSLTPPKPSSQLMLF